MPGKMLKVSGWEGHKAGQHVDVVKRSRTTTPTLVDGFASSASNS
jgi:hypothetical protein